MGSRSNVNSAAITFTRRDVATNDLDVSEDALTALNVDLSLALAGQTDWSAGKITDVTTLIATIVLVIAELPGNTG